MLLFIDKAITKILSHNLAVVIDLHDEKETFESKEGGNNLLVFWKNLANHLASFDPNNVVLELLNEPIFNNKEEVWLQLQERLITTVREQAPHNTIIATGATWGGIYGLQKVKPYQDTNIIYSFHFYEPMAFTHQGANWAGNDFPSIANLEYPYNDTNCAQVFRNVTTDDARDTVQQYCDKKWNKDALVAAVQSAVDWSAAHAVPVWVGEFGVFCKQTPRASKLQWIKDVKNIFEQNHIGWSLWGYDDCFGLAAQKENGKITYDKEVLQALEIKNDIKLTSTIPSTTINPPWAELVGTTWQWQLTEPVDQSVTAKVYDIDNELNDASVVASLHEKKRKVICYISVGTVENWRKDAGQFPKSVIGKDYIGWPGEKWLDIRQINIIGPIMQKRFDMCQQKGFDAVEPDIIHAYQEDSGFSLTYDDQLVYNKWIATQAHQRGLLIGLKNDSEQIKELLPYFDFAITEDCYQQGWCGEVTPFISSGKPVFAAEYTDTGMTTDKFCAKAKQMRFSGILKRRNLDVFRQSCNE